MDMLLKMRVESICKAFEEVGTRPLGALAELDNDSLLSSLSTRQRVQIGEALLAFILRAAQSPASIVPSNSGVASIAISDAKRRFVRVCNASDFAEASAWIAPQSELARSVMQQMIDWAKD